MNEATEILATVLRVVYHNEENNHSVVLMETDTDKELLRKSFTAVGPIYKPEESTTYLLKGDWINNPRYGKQFKIETAQPKTPKTLKGIKNYLAKSNIRGLGPKLADRIVDYFKEDLILIIENDDIERFKEVPGIGEKKVEAIIEAWQEQRELRETMIALQNYGIDGAISQKLYKKYQEKTLTKILENPYQLTDDIYGIGFLKADEIAYKVGIKSNNPFRLKSGIKYALERTAQDNGNVYLVKEILVNEAMKLMCRSEEFQADRQKIQEQIEVLIATNDLIEENDKVYLYRLHKAEKTVVKHLLEINASDINKFENEISIEKIEKANNIKYDNTQTNAIATALKSKIMVLTGGPGTGKTTVIKGIITALKMKKLIINLAAPTGRAAKRMQEATGDPAQTIHRLLIVNPTTKAFDHDELNPLEGDVLILDECSMIDINLFSSLVKAIPANMKLIMVGDIDQLPSVGPGNVLRDIINSQIFPVIQLQTIHRQAMESKIITNAHLINKGKMPELNLPITSDFLFIEESDPQKIIERIVKLTKNFISRKGEVQILAPMKKRSGIGTQEINERLQQELNPTGEEIKNGFTIYRLNDKVMQLKNNYDKNVYNGDVGIITKVDTKENTLKVTFEGISEPVEYTKTELTQLTLAYACTIHKSQGSEYQIVIIPYTNIFYIMLQRNLLYTGITRAKRKLILIGETKAIQHSVKNSPILRRNTTLAAKLFETYLGQVR
mgnify:CR=1 FL=1